MSLRSWTSALERKDALRVVMQSFTLYNNILLQEDSSVSDLSLSDSSFDSLDSDDSSLDNSLSSSSTASLALNMIGAAIEYVKHVYDPMEDTEVIWGKSILVENINTSDALDYFRFRKHHLQAMMDKLWPRMQILLSTISIATKERVSVGNRYAVPYKTGMLMVLFRLSRVQRLRPDVEKYFGIRRSKASKVIRFFSESIT